jgi:hypothetical protein
MQRAADVTVPKRVWTILTDPADATITGVRLQNLGGFPVRIQAKADANAPETLSVQGSLILGPGEIIYATDTLANLFPGVTSPLHLFAWSPALVEISVNHA